MLQGNKCLVHIYIWLHVICIKSCSVLGVIFSAILCHSLQKKNPLEDGRERSDNNKVCPSSAPTLI